MKMLNIKAMVGKVEIFLNSQTPKNPKYQIFNNVLGLYHRFHLYFLKP